MNHLTRDLVFLGLLFALGALSLLWRHRHPLLYGFNIVPPGRKFNRLETTGLVWVALGVVIAVGIQIVNSFHPLNPSFRTGELDYAEGSMLVGAVFFLIGRVNRRKPDSSPHSDSTQPQ